MRLTVFGPGFPFRGGIARTTTELVCALEERGHELLFLTPKRQYPRWLYPGISDRDPEACPSLDCARAVIDPFDPITWRTAGRLATEHRADAWIIPYWTWAWLGIWRSLLKSRRRPPAVAVVHNPVDHDARFWQRLAARRILGSCQGLFTHAEVLGRELAREYPSIPTRHHGLPAAGDPVWTPPDEARAVLDLPADRRVALFLGLIRPYKGVDILLEAAADLPPDSDWLILIAGEPWGNLRDRIEGQVRSLGLGDRVRLRLGWVPEAQVPVMMAAADILVLPYRRGSQSAVAPMALAQGLPVLSTAVGGVPEIVRDGINGVIVPPEDPQSLGRALQALNRDRLRELATAAREGSQALNWSGYALGLEELLSEIT